MIPQVVVRGQDVQDGWQNDVQSGQAMEVALLETWRTGAICPFWAWRQSQASLSAPAARLPSTTTTKATRQATIQSTIALRSCGIDTNSYLSLNRAVSR
jgi:hypothetical protein